MPAMLPALSRASLLLLLAACGIVVAASSIGQMATITGLKEWYPGLIKPSFTPPNIAFPIVWPILYALMSFGFWRILRLTETTPEKGMAVRLFLVQIALNAAWSIAFFGWRSPLAGLAVVLALEAAILMTMRAFWRLDRVAGAVLAPYALWVGFATVLNAAILMLNS